MFSFFIVDDGLYILNRKSFKKHTADGDHFIKFYAPWCKHCEALAPIWAELAKSFKDNPSIKIGQLDCMKAESICQEKKIQSYPFLVFMRGGVLHQAFSGNRDIQSLKDFIQERTGINKDEL